MSDQDHGPGAPEHVPPERVIAFDLAQDEALKYDVFKRLEEVRDASPKVAYTTLGDHWIVFDREIMQQVLGDAENYSTRHLSGDGGGVGMIPLGLDPPQHAPWRHLLLKHFGPAHIRQLEPFVRDYAERLISKLDGERSVDFLKAVGEPMPVSVFMELMGLPLERLDEFRTLVMTVLNPSDDLTPELRGETHAKIMAVLAQLIDDRRREPRDDLVSRLLSETVEGRPISEPEMFSMCYLLFLAGLDTVANAMTYGIRYLARDQALQAQIRADRSRIPDLVEKMLRVNTFVAIHRLAKQDNVLDGVQIKAGEMVWLMLWGGSNEPGGDAEGPRHMAFGGGYHLCLGMHLARLELRVMYETWFDRIAAFSLAPDDRPNMSGGSVMTIASLLLNIETHAAAQAA